MGKKTVVQYVVEKLEVNESVRSCASRTLGIVERAAACGMLEFAPTLAALKAHGFYVSPILERHFLERDALRRTEKPDPQGI